MDQCSGIGPALFVYAILEYGDADMSNAFVNKMRSFAQLTDEDVGQLQHACANVRTFPARYDLIREGDKPTFVFVMLSGWACRYKLLPEGGR